MKYKYILPILLLVTSIGAASAGNDTTSLDKIVDMKEVGKSASTSWKTLSPLAYLVIGIAFIAFIVIVIISILGGAIEANISRRTGDSDKHSRGMEGIKTAVASVIMVVIAIVVIGMFLKML